LLLVSEPRLVMHEGEPMPSGILLLCEIIGKVDCLIISITQDEEEAATARFVPFARVDGERCSYAIGAQSRIGNDLPYIVATTRLHAQGNAIAQSLIDFAAREIRPARVVLCGIAGGYLDEDFGLGDVLFATRVADPRVGALTDAGEEGTNRGGELHPEILRLATGLNHRKTLGELKEWGSRIAIGMDRPSLKPDTLAFGQDVPGATQEKFRRAIGHHLSSRYEPVVRIGAVIGQDKLIKQLSAAESLKRSARDALAIEMESAGAFEGCKWSQTPLMIVRGISDIPGIARQGAWSRYAANTAASFLEALLHSSPFPAANVESPPFLPADWTVRALPPGDNFTPAMPIQLEVVSNTTNPLPNWETDVEAISFWDEQCEVFCQGALDGDSAMARRVMSYGRTMAIGAVSAPQARLLSKLLATPLARDRKLGELCRIFLLSDVGHDLFESAAFRRRAFDSMLSPQAEDIADLPEGMLLDYVIATYVVDRYREIGSIVERSTGEIDPEIFSDLAFVYPYRINRFIREILEDATRSDLAQLKQPVTQQRILSVIKAAFSSVDTIRIALGDSALKLLTHCAYLAGRLTQPQLKDQAKKLLAQNLSLVDRGSTTRLTSAELVYVRAIQISLGFLGDESALESYFMRLLSNPEFDVTNRGFHLEYYGDQVFSLREPLASRDSLGSMEITHGVLLSQIKARLGGADRRKNLGTRGTLELLTLAALTINRLELGTLSVPRRHQIANVIRSATSLATEAVRAYLELAIDAIDSSGQLGAELVHEFWFAKHQPRTGWARREARRVESVGAHTFGAMTLALLTLPDAFPEELWEAGQPSAVYDKSKIIQMLLVHDIAEGVTGDIPEPEKTDEDRERERALMRKLSLLGNFDFLARVGDRHQGTNSLFTTYDLYEEFCIGATLNARIAKDFDRLEPLLEVIDLVRRDLLGKRGEAVYADVALSSSNGIATKLVRQIADSLLSAGKRSDDLQKLLEKNPPPGLRKSATSPVARSRTPRGDGRRFGGKIKDLPKKPGRKTTR
jgi:nucleoside phosphorylase/5'-deoxynucleotidase YfbR-like HD superfamily hydrolase